MICRPHQNYHGLRAEPEAKDGTAEGIATVEHLHTVTIKGGQMAQQGYPARQQRRKRERHGHLLKASAEHVQQFFLRLVASFLVPYG
jgi:hypothetical protein